MVYPAAAVAAEIRRLAAENEGHRLIALYRSEGFSQDIGCLVCGCLEEAPTKEPLSNRVAIHNQSSGRSKQYHITVFLGRPV